MKNCGPDAIKKLVLLDFVMAAPPGLASYIALASAALGHNFRKKGPSVWKIIHGTGSGGTKVKKIAQPAALLYLAFAA